MTTRLSLTLATLLAILGLGATAPHASAQVARNIQFEMSDGPFGGGTTRPAMNERQFERYARVLGLDETQRIVAGEMLAEYRKKFDEAANEVRERRRELMEKARATGDFGVFREEMPDVNEKWSKASERLERELLDNLRSLLREDQLENWSSFEREKRRAELLPDARLGGEDVDVATLVTEIVGDDETLDEVDRMLDQYAIEVDAALRARKRALEDLQPRWFEAMRSDKEAARKIWDEATAKRAAVRDVNRRYIESIATALDEHSAARLREEFLRRSYPLAFEETRAEAMLKEANDLDSLSTDQVEALDAIAEEVNVRLESVSRRLIEEIRKAETEPPAFLDNIQIRGGEGAVALTVVGGRSGDEDEKPYDGLLAERYDYSTSIIERIRTVLTPEQIGRLPDVSRENTGGAFGRAFRFRL